MGLFDFESPEKVRNTIRQEGMLQDQMYARTPRGRGPVAAAASAGRQFGQALGGADPRVEKAQKMQQAQQMVMQSGLTPDQPEFYDAAADALMQMGLQQEAFNAKMAGQKFKQDQETRGVDLDHKRALTENLLRGKEQSAQSRIGKLVSDFKRGFINEEQLQIGIENLKKKGGVNIGDVTIGGTDPLGKPAVNKLEQSISDTTQQLDRLSAIEDEFDPRFLETPNRMLMDAYNSAEKFGVALDESSKKELAESSEFLQDSINNINLYIKYITGAQMSYQEADRLRLAAPDPGEGVFGKDGPTRYKAKLSNSIRGAKLARMRAIYMRKKGMTPKYLKDEEGRDDVSFPMSLSAIEDIYEKRAQTLEKAIAKENPNLKGNDLVNAVRAQLKEEFGM